MAMILCMVYATNAGCGDEGNLMTPDVHYAKIGDVHIAYTVFGEGPLVSASGAGPFDDNFSGPAVAAHIRAAANDSSSLKQYLAGP